MGNSPLNGWICPFLCLMTGGPLENNGEKVGFQIFFAHLARPEKPWNVFLVVLTAAFWYARGPDPSDQKIVLELPGPQGPKFRLGDESGGYLRGADPIKRQTHIHTRYIYIYTYIYIRIYIYIYIHIYIYD
jgi:hypothetical protein